MIMFELCGVEIADSGAFFSLFVRHTSFDSRWDRPARGTLVE